MKLATFNVENMFQRPAAMNLPDWKDGKDILQDFTSLNDLIAKAEYKTATKQKILEIMGKYAGLLTKGSSKYIFLQEVRQKLLKRPGGKPIEVVANGRADWVGWFELTKQHVTEAAIENTARVIDAVGADAVCVVEAEDRTALRRFNDGFLKSFDVGRYEHIMLIDGNDERGIDVGILSRGDFPIMSICSHVDDQDGKGIIFSRDCPEYKVTTPSGNELLILVNHLKSKGYGGQASSSEKRKRQATRIREIYEQRLGEGQKYIAIVGDFNDTPDSDALSPLFDPNLGLIDIMSHSEFQSDGREGTFGNGSKSQKLDYILLSPELAGKTIGGGIERRGVWGGTNGTLFPHFDEIKSKKDVASDHAALWAEFNI